MIEPTVGRVVWFRPGPRDGITRSGGPLAAIVAHVHNERLVNLSVIDSNGQSWPRTLVQLAQDGDSVPGNGSYCEWMPYQKGQAAKAEALEQRLSA